MPKSENQKLKLLYLLKVLLHKTDEGHYLTMPQIVEELKKYDIQAERKSIYDDIRALNQYGIEIETRRGSSGGYAVLHREFELVELKLLVEAVQASKFITVKKSQELIKKLERLCSKYEAIQLHREVYVTNRIKAMNESIYYIVDDIQQALSKNVQIDFYYMEWNIHGELQKKKEGKRYIVSPWALSLADDNYYLIAYDHISQIVKHYRVDKMLDIQCRSEHRIGSEYFQSFDTAIYARHMFGMFGGELQKIKLSCHNSIIGVIFDRFGRNLYMHKSGEEHMIVVIDAVVSNQFFGWLFGLGDKVKLLSPSSVVTQMKGELEKQVKLYANNSQ